MCRKGRKCIVNEEQAPCATTLLCEGFAEHAGVVVEVCDEKMFVLVLVPPAIVAPGQRAYWATRRIY